MIPALWQRFYVNTVWIDHYVQPVNKDFVLSITTLQAVCIIEVVASIAFVEIAKLNLCCLDGKARAIKKSPVAMFVDFVPNMPPS
jgi:hypothetical protein